MQAAGMHVAFSRDRSQRRRCERAGLGRVLGRDEVSEGKEEKKKSKKKTKPKVCHKTQTVPMAITAGAAGAFQAAVARLPYSEPITFVVDISNAAGLQATPLSTSTTLHKPKPKKPKKKPKKKSKKKR